MKAAIRIITVILGLVMVQGLHAQEKLNVLFIAVDDLKPMIGAFGEEQIRTPEIDRLASGGMIFTNSHCQQAVCGPSRASLMTGMRPDYTRVWDLKTRMRDMVPDILTIPEYFKDKGYSTVAIGKIYDPRCVDNHYDLPSWTIPYKESSRYEYPSEYGEPALSYYALPEAKAKVKELQLQARNEGVNNISEYVRANYKPSVEKADVPDEAYMDGQIARNGMKYMEELASSGKPFFLAVGFKRPHLPFTAPAKYWDQYNRDDIRLAEYRDRVKDGVELAYHNYGELRSYTDIPPFNSFTDIFSDQLSESKQKELIHGYYASVSFIDSQIGKLINHLKMLGLDKNTVIVLWGDHGWHLGDHAMWCKHSNFEQATRSPLVITYPGGKEGNYTYPVEFIDIFPTLCELAGLETPTHLQGISLVPAMKDPQHKIKPFAVSQFGRGKINGYSIRTERYRLTLWLKDGYRTWMPFTEDMIEAGEIYDYKKDPNETINLYNSKDHIKVKERLMNNFTRFIKKQNKTIGPEVKPEPGSNKGSSRPTPKSKEITFKDFSSNWKTYARNGAETDFSHKGGNQIVVVRKAGNNISDTGFQTRKGLDLKKGDKVKIDMKALGGDIRIVLGPVGDQRLIEYFKGRSTFISKSFLFEIPVDGTWQVKIQLTETGLFEIENLRISVE